MLMSSSKKRSTAITADTTIVKGVFTAFWRYEIKKRLCLPLYKTFNITQLDMINVI